ncbi:tudor domain-containing protein 1-like [Saccoglossus kowalevskii]
MAGKVLNYTRLSFLELTGRSVDEAEKRFPGHMLVSKKSKFDDNDMDESSGAGCGVCPILVKSLPVVDLPDCSEIPVVVTEVRSPLEMYCQVATVENLKILSPLFEELNAYYNETLSSLTYNPIVGELCAAQFMDDQSWSRAEVLDVKPNFVDVKYIDFGNQETVPLSCVRPLTDLFAKLPIQAFKCKLADIQPTCDAWNPDAVELMQNLTGMGTKRLLAQVTNNAGDVTELTLVDKTPSEDIDIAGKLVEAGVATRVSSNVIETGIAASNGSPVQEAPRSVSPVVADDPKVLALLQENAALKARLDEQQMQLQQIMKLLSAAVAK